MYNHASLNIKELKKKDFNKSTDTVGEKWGQTCSRIIFFMHPANERWHYIATSSLIGWMHTQNNPCIKPQYIEYTVSGMHKNIENFQMYI